MVVETGTRTRSDRVGHGRRVVQFVALSFVLSWVPWVGLGVSGVDVNTGIGQLIFGVAAAGPSLAALLMWLARPRERIRGIGRTTWYGLAAGLLLGALPPVITAILLHSSDLSVISGHAAEVAAGVGGVVGVIGYTLIAGPLAEEFGWRGYLQPRLRARHGRAATAMLIGLVWGAWHIPLFLLPGTGQHDLGLFTTQGLVFFATLIPFSYLILLVTEQLRGGVWAAVAAHAGFNAASALMPSDGWHGSVLVLCIFTALTIAAVVALPSTELSERG